MLEKAQTMHKDRGIMCPEQHAGSVWLPTSSVFPHPRQTQEKFVHILSFTLALTSSSFVQNFSLSSAHLTAHSFILLSPGTLVFRESNNELPYIYISFKCISVNCWKICISKYIIFSLIYIIFIIATHFLNLVLLNLLSFGILFNYCEVCNFVVTSINY